MTNNLLILVTPHICPVILLPVSCDRFFVLSNKTQFLHLCRPCSLCGYVLIIQDLLKCSAKCSMYRSWEKPFTDINYAASIFMFLMLCVMLMN